MIWMAGIAAGIFAAVLCMIFYRKGIRDGMKIRQGASDEEIIEVLKNAAGKGMVSQEFVATVVSTVQGGGSAVVGQSSVQNSAPTGKTQQAVQAQSTQNSKVLEMIMRGAQSGDIPQKIAEGLFALAKQGAGDETIIEALKNAAAQGLISQEFVSAVTSAV